MAEDRPDIDAARKQMRATVGSGKEVKLLASHLWEGERVEKMAQAQPKGEAQAGLLVLTDRRLLFVKEGMFGRGKTEDFTFDRITSVEFSKGMATADLKVMAMGNESKFNVNKDDGKEMTDLIRNRTSGAQRVAPGAAAQPVPPAAGSVQGGEPAPDIPEQIRKLAELRDEGMLTEEQFEAKKAELLSRM
jgi:Bacterial PH domain/Short C-terminal domain